MHAVDLDEVAVEVAAEAARRNGTKVKVARADVLRDELPITDVVVANIELAVVEQLLRRVAAHVVVTSGYLDSEQPQAEGWICAEQQALEGWAADVFVRAALS